MVIQKTFVSEGYILLQLQQAQVLKALKSYPLWHSHVLNPYCELNKAMNLQKIMYYHIITDCITWYIHYEG